MQSPAALGHTSAMQSHSSTSAALQPPIPGQPPRADSFSPGAASPRRPPVPLPVPIPRGAFPDTGNFSFRGNPSLLQKNQSSKPNEPGDAPREPDGGSSQMLDSSSVSATDVQSTTTTSSATTMTSSGISFVVAPTAPSSHKAPGLPGFVVPSTPIMSSPAVSATNSSSVRMPVVSASLAATNPPMQQHMYPPFPSITPPGASPQGQWLPPQVSGALRPPYLPYPPVYPGPFPLAVRGTVLPPAISPSSLPPGVTPVGDIITSASSITEAQREMPPPGTEESTHSGSFGCKDITNHNKQAEAWSAHRTETGAVYYYNAVSGKSTYEKPPGFQGEPDKVTAQPTPVSWEKLPGTDWALVTTNDGKTYYYNTKTKVSSWQIPTEVIELKKTQESVNVVDQSMSVSNSEAVVTDKASTTTTAVATVATVATVAPSTTFSAPALNTGGRDSAALRTLTAAGAGSSAALDLIKKKLQDSGIPASSTMTSSTGLASSDVNGSGVAESTFRGLQSENSKDKPKENDGDGNLSDLSSDSEDMDSGPTKEECIIQFKEMLKERGVAPFSKWDKELPKIVFDPRFKAISTHAERRSLFEHYVRKRAEEERKEKRAAQKAAIEGFKNLLEEAKEDIDEKTDYQTFRKKWGHDPRFEALNRKEREALLNERVHSLKKEAEGKAKAARLAVASSFKSMLRERGDITTNSRWSRVKDSIRDDPRYKSVKHEDREILFNEYISDLKTAEDEAERVAKAKRDEQEKLRERERETRKRKEREEQEMERIRLKVRRKEAVSSYQALLVETIKDPQASWKESKAKLERDPQGRATNLDLDESDMEKLFREHIKMLNERCTHDYKALLVEVITVEASARETEDRKTVLNSWSTAKHFMKADPRYTKMPRKDREALWRRHVEEIQRKQKVSPERRDEKHSELRHKSSTDLGRAPGRATR